MSLIKRILYRLSSNRPLRVIDEDGRPYLERYFVFRAFGMRCYLHRFVGDDPARGLHDHPWPWALSIIIAGWYREHRRDGIRIVRWFNWLNGDHFHRVTLPITAYSQLKTFEETHLSIHGNRDTLPQAWNDWLETIQEVDQIHADNSCWSIFIHRDKAVKPWGFWKETVTESLQLVKKIDGGYLGIPNEDAKRHATWQQFTYDRPKQMGSSEWWLDRAKYPLAKDHPKRLPEQLS